MGGLAEVEDELPRDVAGDAPEEADPVGRLVEGAEADRRLDRRGRAVLLEARLDERGLWMEAAGTSIIRLLESTPT